MPDTDLTRTERRAWVAFRLGCGERFTTAQAAQMLNCTTRDAYDWLMRISRAICIFYDDPDDPDGPRWQKLR